MFYLHRAVQSVINRILAGNTVPVKKEFQQMIGEELAEKGVRFTTNDDKTNPNSVLFKATKK